MAYVAPSTRAYGALITAAIWNQDVVDNPIHLASMKFGASALSAISAGMLLAGSGFFARKTATQAITGGVTTKVTWDAEDYDPDAAFDLTNERYTAPSAGRYLLTYRITTANDNSITFVAYYVNGVEVYRSGNASAGISGCVGSILLNLAASDYVELFIQKNSTQNINSANNVTWWCGAKVGLA